MENKDIKTDAPKADAPKPLTPPSKFTVNATSLRQQEALEAIVGERAYQDATWNEKTTSTSGKHSVMEFFAVQQVIINEAMLILAHESEPRASEKALHHMRKIGGCAVSCLEQNGVRRREVKK
jgi:hypothetical protein